MGIVDGKLLQRAVSIGRLSRCLQYAAAVASVTAATVVTAGCSGQASEAPGSTVTLTRSSAAPQPSAVASSPTSTSPTEAALPAPTLSTRNTGPLVVEDIKSQFWEDYSFVTAARAAVTAQDLAAINSGAYQLSPPYGAVIANREWILITVAGNSSAPITINEMTVRKTCRQPLSGGTLFYSPIQGGGPFPTAPISYDLDTPNTVGQYAPAPPSTIPAGGNFFAKKVITLRYQEPQTLAVFVSSSRYCQFSFDLNMATINGPARQVIDDNGRSFAITAVSESSTGARVQFSSYSVVYAGGFANRENGGKFVQVDPSTYDGAGNPASFPVR